MPDTTLVLPAKEASPSRTSSLSIGGLPESAGVPAGGQSGQALLKLSDADQDVGWKNVAEASVGGGATQAALARETEDRQNADTALGARIDGIRQFSQEDEAKLDGIQPGAEVNVSPDWDSTSGDSRILNKPDVPDNADIDARILTEAREGNADRWGKPKLPSDTVYDISGKADQTDLDAEETARNNADLALGRRIDTETTNRTSADTALGSRIDGVRQYPQADEDKLDGIAANAEVNVPSDWNATSGDARILNKPDIFSGAYDDLTGKPTVLSQAQVDARIGMKSNLPSDVVYTDTQRFTAALLAKLNALPSSTDLAFDNHPIGTAAALNALSRTTAGLDFVTITAAIASGITSGIVVDGQTGNSLTALAQGDLLVLDHANDRWERVVNLPAETVVSQSTVRGFIDGAFVRGLLTGLTGANRLPYSAIRDTPSVPGNTEIDARILAEARAGNTDRWGKPKLPTDVVYDISGKADQTDLDAEETARANADTALGSRIDNIRQFSQANETKLAGIETGAEVNVKSDWGATTGDAEILNKPVIPAAQVPADWNKETGVDRILNKPTIPTLDADSILDLFKTTRVEADRGKFLGISETNENALGLFTAASGARITVIENALFPAPPTDVVVVPGNGGTPTRGGFVVSWTKAPYAVGYRIRYRLAGSTRWAFPITLGDVDSHNIRFLTSGTSYDLEISSINSLGAISLTSVTRQATASSDLVLSAISTWAVGSGTMGNNVTILHGYLRGTAFASPPAITIPTTWWLRDGVESTYQGVNLFTEPSAAHIPSSAGKMNYTAIGFHHNLPASGSPGTLSSSHEIWVRIMRLDGSNVIEGKTVSAGATPANTDVVGIYQVSGATLSSEDMTFRNSLQTFMNSVFTANEGFVMSLVRKTV